MLNETIKKARERRRMRLYRAIPYLIFAALAAGFLAGVPRAAATAAIAQTDRATVSYISRRETFLPFAAGLIGRTNANAGAVSKLPEFTYTGTYTLMDDGDGNWRIKFLSSGTLTMARSVTIDLFLVGGGGGGGYNYGAGGGGGYTTTVPSVGIAAGTPCSIMVGSGGTTNGFNSVGSRGGTTTGFSYSATGGYGGGYGEYNSPGVGGAGGSGGGGYNLSAGGSNGSAGQGGGGAGQGTTTKEFGETSGVLYAGGGGSWNGAGGAGGGGSGGGSGTANTGGGAGGNSPSCSGGSGICIIRNHRAA